MNLVAVKTIKELLLKYDAKPNKKMGQNFLVSAPTLSKIIEAADLTKNDIVLEVGPGIGTLTEEIAKIAKKVIAVEKDKVMTDILKEVLKDYKNVEIIRQDIRYLNPKSYTLYPNYKVVANIPYYLSSLLIRNFLESKNPPKEIILMVQKEVAQRICAKPPHMSLLAVSVQFYAKVEIINYISKNCFWPVPEVDSAIIRIEIRNQKIENRKNINRKLFFKIVKAGFSQPRKQLANNLSKILKINREKVNNWLLNNNIDPNRRAETLRVDDWINLANNFGQAK